MINLGKILKDKDVTTKKYVDDRSGGYEPDNATIELNSSNELTIKSVDTVKSQFTEATTLANINTNETITTIFGKIKKAITDFITHKSDTVIHIASADRSKWNNKVPQLNTLPTASADYVDIVVQYIGATTLDYTNGLFYECISETTNNITTYRWIEKIVQENLNLFSQNVYDNLPQSKKEDKNYIYFVEDENDWEINLICKDLFNGMKKDIVNYMYPIGHTITSFDSSFNPNTSYVGTTWKKVSEGYFIEATEDSTKVGTTHDAGIPNIEGTTGGTRQDNSMPDIKASGAFSKENNAGGFTGDAGRLYNATFKASNGEVYVEGGWKTDADKVYGKSNTVQPKSILTFIWERVA